MRNEESRVLPSCVTLPVSWILLHIVQNTKNLDNPGLQGQIPYSNYNNFIHDIYITDVQVSVSLLSSFESMVN